ncbi:MAG TPA: methyltransferase [Polyangiaceae bacterium]|nr:methyltransferase [Polyangiaceae bacterium]
MVESELASPRQYLALTAGKWQTHLLAAAGELQLGDILKDGPLSVEQVATRATTDAAMTHRLLRALAALGIVVQQDDQRFALTGLGQFLRSDIPPSMRALSMMGGRAWHDRCWEQLAQSVRSGTPGAELAFGAKLWDYFNDHQGDFANFNEAMTAASAGMHFTAAQAYDFSRFKLIADIGGGFGRLMALLLARTPGLRGIVFDRAQLADGCNAELRNCGVSDRCQFVAGDFFESVPEGADCHMMAHILHDWDDEQAVRILKTSRRSLAAGDTLLVLDAVIKGGPQDFGALMDLEIFLLFGGRDRTEPEFAKLFSEAGFQLTRVIPTQSTISIIEGVAV